MGKERNEEEATLVGLRFLINRDGNIVAETSGIPPEEVGRVFKNNDTRFVVSLLVNEGRSIFRETIEAIERVLNEVRR